MRGTAFARARGMTRLRFARAALHLTLVAVCLGSTQARAASSSYFWEGTPMGLEAEFRPSHSPSEVLAQAGSEVLAVDASGFGSLAPFICSMLVKPSPSRPRPHSAFGLLYGGVLELIPEFGTQSRPEEKGHVGLRLPDGGSIQIYSSPLISDRWYGRLTMTGELIQTQPFVMTGTLAKELSLFLEALEYLEDTDSVQERAFAATGKVLMPGETFRLYSFSVRTSFNRLGVGSVSTQDYIMAMGELIKDQKGYLLQTPAGVSYRLLASDEKTQVFLETAIHQKVIAAGLEERSGIRLFPNLPAVSYLKLAK